MWQSIWGYFSTGNDIWHILFTSLCLAFIYCRYNNKGYLIDLKKIKIRRFCLIFCVDMVTGFVLMFFLYLFAYLLNANHVYLIPVYFFLFFAQCAFHGVVFHCFRDLRDWSVMLSFIAATITVNSIAMLITMIVEDAFGYNIPIFFILPYIAVFAYTFVMVKFSVRDKDVSQGGWLLLLIISIFSMVLSVCSQCVIILRISAIGISFLNVYHALVYIVLYFFVLSTYIAIYFISIERKQYARLMMENQLIRATNYQIEQVKANMTEIKKIRHDIKNQFSYIAFLSDHKDYTELDRVIHKGLDLNLESEVYFDCGNAEISAILSLEASKAQKNGLSLDTAIVVPEKLPFDSVDLCAVICNLIDNAMESHLRYKITPPILVRIHPRKDFLYIGVENDIPEDVASGELLSLKTSKTIHSEEHGLGCEIVKRIADKYNGHVVFDIQNKKFIAEVLLNMDYAIENTNNR